MAAAATAAVTDDQVAVDQDYLDADESYGSDVESYTTSLASNVTDYRYLGGRRYHTGEESDYPFPNDEKESDRMDIAHQMMRAGLNGKLFRAPVKNPKRVLDIGTGTGVWAIEFGEDFPDAQVIGNDLSPIQPKWVPPNVQFEVDNVEKDWTFSTKFSLINCRAMYGAISNWPGLVEKVFNFVEPGGYGEFYDFDLVNISPDKSAAEDSPLLFLNKHFREQLEAGGMDPNPGRSLEKWVKAAGFEDVTVHKIPCPMGTWPKDKQLKQIGAWNYLQLDAGFESFINYLFTNKLGWGKEEIDVLCAKCRKQLKDPKSHVMVWLYNVVGKKPEK